MVSYFNSQRMLNPKYILSQEPLLFVVKVLQVHFFTAETVKRQRCSPAEPDKSVQPIGAQYSSQVMPRCLKLFQAESQTAPFSLQRAERRS